MCPRRLRHMRLSPLFNLLGVGGRLLPMAVAVADVLALALALVRALGACIGD